MTKKQKIYKVRLIRNIQIQVKSKLLDRDHRIYFMKSRFGKKMSINGLKFMLQYIKSKINGISLQISSLVQLDKIYELWQLKALDKSSIALDAFIRQICRKTSLKFITAKNAENVLITLNKMK